MEWHDLSVWPYLYLHTETLQAVASVTGADFRLRCGKFSEAKVWASKALEEMQMLIRRMRRLRWLAEALEKDTQTACGLQHHELQVDGSGVLTDSPFQEAADDAEDGRFDEEMGSPRSAGVTTEQKRKRRKRAPKKNRQKVEHDRCEEVEDHPEHLSRISAEVVMKSESRTAIDGSSSQLHDADDDGTHEQVEDLALPAREALEDQTDSILHELAQPAPTLLCKRVMGHLAGNDAGSGAFEDLSYYEVQEDGWMMFGHGVGQEMIVVKQNQFVRRATKWTRCWIDAGSKKPQDYAIYIPGCDDPEYVACGVVFVFGGDNWEKPRADVPVAMVHKSLMQPSVLGKDLWSDVGTGAHCNVKLNLVPGLNIAWPTLSTLMGCPPPAAIPKVTLIGNPSDVIVPRPLVVRNTFIDFPRAVDPSLEGFFRVRQVRSVPCSPCTEVISDAPGHFQFDYSGISDMVVAASAALLEHVACDETSTIFSEHDTEMVREPTVGHETGNTSVCFPSAVFSMDHGWARGRPREVIFQHICFQDVCHLASACRLLRRWSQTASQSVPSAAQMDDVLIGIASEPPHSAPQRIRQRASSSPSVEASTTPSILAAPSSQAHASYHSVRGSTCVRRPCDVILQFLSPAQVCCMRAACHKLLRWSQTGLVMVVAPSCPQANLGDAASADVAYQLPANAEELGHESPSCYLPHSLQLTACIAPPVLPAANVANLLPTFVQPSSLEIDHLLSGPAETQMPATQRRTSCRLLRRDRVAQDRHNALELQSALLASAPRHFVFPHLTETGGGN